MKQELSIDVRRVADLEAHELMRECAKDLRNADLWGEFHKRFRRKINLYLLRAFRALGGKSDEFDRYAEDWAQEVFTKLVQNEGRVISSFRGSTELSVYAFLGSIALSVVADQLRFQRALRRRAQVIALDQLQDFGLPHRDSESQFSALLDLIDVERVLREDQESKNPERDFLIFKLHFVEGLSVREIASIRELNLTTSGLEKVLNRVRNRLVRKL